MKKQALMMVAIVVMILIACDKENETKISTSNSNESHKTGQNCMDCHVSGGEGEGWFVVAGSVYQKDLTTNFPNAVVMLTTEPNAAGAEIMEVEVDKLGNFYTTESVSFGDGVYVSVKGNNGEQVFMNSKITNGKCNSCHGASTDRIWIQ